MPSWPNHWVTMALQAAGIESTSNTRAIMKAWQKSTPTLPQTYNPIGIPASFASLPRVPNTEYALMPSMTAFNKVFARFMASQPGKSLKVAMESDKPFPASWRIIDGLKWPASKTETDYPSALLDLTAASYQASVKATDPAKRKTSGTSKAPAALKNTILEHNRSVVAAVATMSDGKSAVQHLIRKHRNNG